MTALEPLRAYLPIYPPLIPPNPTLGQDAIFLFDVSQPILRHRRFISEQGPRGTEHEDSCDVGNLLGRLNVCPEISIQMRRARLLSLPRI